MDVCHVGVHNSTHHLWLINMVANFLTIVGAVIVSLVAHGCAERQCSEGWFKLHKRCYQEQEPDTSVTTFSVLLYLWYYMYAAIPNKQSLGLPPTGKRTDGLLRHVDPRRQNLQVRGQEATRERHHPVSYRHEHQGEHKQ